MFVDTIHLGHFVYCRIMEAEVNTVVAEPVVASFFFCTFMLGEVVFLQAGLVARLRAQQQSLTKERKRLSQQLKNEQRKRQRMKQKAKQLSNEDLVAVLAERQAVAQAKAKAKAQPRRDRTGEQGQ